jgi:hypothetical protein
VIDACDIAVDEGAALGDDVCVEGALDVADGALGAAALAPSETVETEGAETTETVAAGTEMVCADPFAAAAPLIGAAPFVSAGPSETAADPAATLAAPALALAVSAGGVLGVLMDDLEAMAVSVTWSGSWAMATVIPNAAPRCTFLETCS